MVLCQIADLGRVQGSSREKPLGQRINISHHNSGIWLNGRTINNLDVLDQHIESRK